MIHYPILARIPTDSRSPHLHRNHPRAEYYDRFSLVHHARATYVTSIWLRVRVVGYSRFFLSHFLPVQSFCFPKYLYDFLF